jgi:ABC-type spermidine/putrescine transport system permease subunit I
MNFLPIAIRELQVTARRSMTYYWRSLSALNAACITLGCLLIGFSGALSASSAGEATFQVLSGVGYGIWPP